MKLTDILLSLFVEFCIIMVAGGTIMTLLLPIVPQEESAPIVAISVVWAIAFVSLLLSGSGWKQNLNKIGLLLIFAMGWLFFSAGLSGFFGIFSSLTIIAAFILHEIGQEYAYSTWIQKLVIIKRNPEYIEDSMQEQPKSEPLGELLG